MKELLDTLTDDKLKSIFETNVIYFLSKKYYVTVPPYHKYQTIFYIDDSNMGKCIFNTDGTLSLTEIEDDTPIKILSKDVTANIISILEDRFNSLFDELF